MFCTRLHSTVLYSEDADEHGEKWMLPLEVHSGAPALPDSAKST
jgi:hypothetical protein